MCCLIILIWFEDSPAQEQVEKKTVPEIEVQKETHYGSTATTWPHPFTPSEEVSGDAQVAFPTDI